MHRWAILLASVIVVAGCHGPLAPRGRIAPATVAAEPGGHDGWVSAPARSSWNDADTDGITLQEALARVIVASGADAFSAHPRRIGRVDLNADGVTDRLVLLRSAPWCRPAGCTLMVFEGLAQGFRFVGATPAVNGPVGVSDARSNGWRALIFRTTSPSGSPRTVALRFDGSKYALDESVPLPADSKLAFSGELLLGP